MEISYEKYLLSRILSVQAIVSADYVPGPFSIGSQHTHNDAWELIISVNGEIQVCCNESVETIKKNQLLLIQPGAKHAVGSVEKGSGAFVISFTCSNDDNLFPLQNRVIHAPSSALRLVEGIIGELKSTFNQQDTRLHLFHFVPSSKSPVGAEQMICCYLEQFLILLLRNETMEHGNVVSTSHFHKTCQNYISDQVNQYISQNLHTFLSVQAIANHFHYSRTRLSFLYKNATGISISDAINNAQIQAAKEMMQDRSISISQISDALGFSSPQYFSRKFSRITGVSPTQYCKTQN